MKKSRKEKSFWGIAKNIDIFGRNISFTHEGDDTIKSPIGTIFTFLFMLGMLIKVLIDFQNVWSG